MLQAVPDAGDRGVVEAPEDELEKMHDQAARIGTATLTRYAEVVHAGLGEMRGATAPRLLLEVVCARLLLPSASDTESALLQRVERIETRLDISIPAAERADSGSGQLRVSQRAIQPAKPRFRNPQPGRPSAGPAPAAVGHPRADRAGHGLRRGPRIRLRHPSAPPPEAQPAPPNHRPVVSTPRRAGRGCRAHHVVDRA